MPVPKLGLDGVQHDSRARKEPESVANALDVAGIPLRYRDITFDEIKRRGMPKDSAWVDAFIKVHSYAHYIDRRITDGDGLILYGANGNLKTSLAIAVLRKFIDAGGTGKFIVMCSLAHTLRAKWACNSNEANIYHDKLIQTPLLIIDDLGAEDTAKDWVTTEIECILAERYNNKRSTIITTNLNKTDLVKTYSMRLIDRLREAAVSVEFKSKSLRRNLTFAEEISRYSLPPDEPAQQEKLLE